MANKGLNQGRSDDAKDPDSLAFLLTALVLLAVDSSLVGFYHLVEVILIWVTLL